MTQATVAVESAGPTLRISLAGEIDMANADTVYTQMANAITNRAAGVTVDVTDLRYVDSAGLRVLAFLAARLRQLNIGFTLTAPSNSPARRVIELAGLTFSVSDAPTEDGSGPGSSE